MTSTTALPIHRPSLVLLGTEPMRAAFEFLSHKMSRRVTACGDGHPVIIFPGLATDGHSVSPLREHCNSLGYAASDWGRGFNTGPQGDVDTWMADLASHVETLLAGHTQAATLIGWSLGGLYAREVAKLLPGRIRQVITIGTPFNAGADHTNVGWLFRLVSGSFAQIDPALGARMRTPPPVPTTSVFSKSDGVVAWQTCQHERPHRQVQDIEVDGSHIGMGWNPRVLRIVADRLAQDPSRWQPYSAAA